MFYNFFRLFAVAIPFVLAIGLIFFGITIYNSFRAPMAETGAASARAMAEQARALKEKK